MRKLVAVLAIVLCAVLAPGLSFAQQNNAAVGCVDASIRIQAEMMKREFIPQGFEVIKNAMINMRSKQAFPVAIEMEKGRQYHIMYIGSKDANEIIFELLDGNDVRVDARVINDPSANNVIHYSFVPERTDMYLLMLTQKLKNKDLCGSITIMRKEDKKPEVVAEKKEEKKAPVKKKTPAKKPVKKK